MKQLSFMIACKTFFGMRPGQSLADFMREIRALTDQDKADLTVMFRTVDIEVVNDK